MTGELAVDYGIRQPLSTPAERVQYETNAEVEARVSAEYARQVAASAATVTESEQQLATQVAERWCRQYRPDLTIAVRGPWTGASIAFRSVGRRWPSLRLAAFGSDVPRDLDPVRADAIADWCRLTAERLPERVCTVCGCSDDDCTACVERTGHACHWISDAVCSACAVGTADRPYRRPVTLDAAREILRDLRQRVEVSGCSRLTAAAIAQEFTAEWIADRVVAGQHAGPDLLDLYAAAKAVLVNETRRATRRQRQHAQHVLAAARARSTTARVAAAVDHAEAS